MITGGAVSVVGSIPRRNHDCRGNLRARTSASISIGSDTVLSGRRQSAGGVVAGEPRRGGETVRDQSVARGGQISRAHRSRYR